MRLLPVQFRPTPLLEAASSVIRTLKGAGFDSGIVGGGVRDSLLGRSLSDCDIVTAARPEELAKLFPGSRLVGASFGVSLVRHGGFEFEVAAARQERFYLDRAPPRRGPVYARPRPSTCSGGISPSMRSGTIR